VTAAQTILARTATDPARIFRTWHKVRVTELPVGSWTDDFKEYLEKLTETTDKAGKKVTYLITQIAIVQHGRRWWISHLRAAVVAVVAVGPLVCDGRARGGHSGRCRPAFVVAVLSADQLPVHGTRALNAANPLAALFCAGCSKVKHAIRLRVQHKAQRRAPGDGHHRLLRTPHPPTQRSAKIIEATSKISGYQRTEQKRWPPG
jgi:hypothetical protein